MTRYLTERLERIQAEKDLANHMGRRYKEALEASKRILSSKETNREYLHNLLKTVTFPVAQPGIDNKSCGQHSTQYLLKMRISVDLESSSGLSDLCVSLLETLSDRQIQIKYE